MLNAANWAALSAATSSYAPPLIVGFTPAQAATAGFELMNVYGENFGASGVATLNFAGIEIERSTVIYASHGRLQLNTTPGIGANHSLLVRVGDAQSSVVSFSYAAPTAASSAACSTSSTRRAGARRSSRRR